MNYTDFALLAANKGLRAAWDALMAEQTIRVDAAELTLAYDGNPPSASDVATMAALQLGIGGFRE